MGLAVLLIAAYGLGLLFSLKTHRELFGSAEHGETGEPPWPLGLALATLAGVTVVVALISEVFVESVHDPATPTFRMPDTHAIGVFSRKSHAMGRVLTACDLHRSRGIISPGMRKERV